MTPEFAASVVNGPGPKVIVFKTPRTFPLKFLAFITKDTLGFVAVEELKFISGSSLLTNINC